MLIAGSYKQVFRKAQTCVIRRISWRQFSSSAVWRAGTQTRSSISTKQTRNVGIIAHIDAGKTTTTERMLYYSGYTKRIGNVDEGSTVTDFLPAERARGITIQSAAITFHWTPRVWLSDTNVSDVYNVNLIDTPGHADFTFEVLRSLRVLDGAVCVLDGVAGVEAQTEKVWFQSQAHGIPTIFYVNKMDRDGAKFGESVKQIAAKLHVKPAVCQIPWYADGKEGFQGVVDVVHQQGLLWQQNGDGKAVKVVSLSDIEKEQPQIAKEARRARTNLVEMLSEDDDIMVENFLERNEDHLAVPPEEIWASLRRCLLSPRPKISPVFAGSSFKNVGVQPVLDAIIRLLPDPSETPDPYFTATGLSGGLRDFMDGKIVPDQPAQQSKKGVSKSRNINIAKLESLEACALAFKVVNDAKRGILVYVRVYHGILNRNALIYNTTLGTAERMPRLLRMYASDAVEEASLHSGEIGVIPGLKYARTGDTFITYSGVNPKNGPPVPFNTLQLRPIDVPPPVFFAAVEPFTSADQSNVDSLLALLLREDPSLQLGENEETGQQLLNGMGELHLEIATNRLIQDFKAKASIGKIEIAYRECPAGSSPAEEVIYERSIAGTHSKAGCIAAVSALMPEEVEKQTTIDGNVIITNGMSQDGQDNDDHDILQALKHGALAALVRGPAFGYPVYGAKVELTYDSAIHSFGNLTTNSAISGAARKAVRTAMEASATQTTPVLLEPVMRVIINVDENTLGPVKRDLEGSRNGVIESLEDIDTVTGTGSLATREDLPQIDLNKIYSPPDPFDIPSASYSNPSNMQADPEHDRQINNRARVIVARVPLKEMIGYLKHLRSLTAGRGSFVMEVDGFKRMTKQRENMVLRELRGNLC